VNVELAICVSSPNGLETDSKLGLISTPMKEIGLDIPEWIGCVVHWIVEAARRRQKLRHLL
jgi:hypothetical protein